MNKDVPDKDDTFRSAGPQLSTAEALKIFLYNSDTGAVLGRTGASWAKIIIFYIFFYLGLAGLFSLSFFLFYKTISEENPKYFLDDSLIGTSPGLGFRPMPEDNEASSLIAFKSGIKGDFRNWTTALDDFLEEYEEKKNGSNVVACSYATKKLPDGKVCAVKQSDWGPCTSNKTYGFQSGKPCVFIKLNKIIKWEPEYFKNAKELPDKMPDDLRKRITELVKKRPNELNTVWVSCEGEKRPDKENQGEIEYFPHQGFPGYYYPFTRQQNYLSPLIALHFKSIKKNVIVKIECRAWAHNIGYSRRDQIGMVRFELLCVRQSTQSGGKMQDGLKDTLVQKEAKLRVRFAKNVVHLVPRKPRTHKVVLAAIGTLFCVAMLLLCAWLLLFPTLPEWQRDDFTIESVPGLRYRPKPPDSLAKGTLITFNSERYEKWTSIIDDFIGQYKTFHASPQESENTIECDYDIDPGDKSCRVDPSNWYPCVSDYHYGYTRAAPCVFLKLNKIHNWVPEYYNDSNSLPHDMPLDLKQHITEMSMRNPNNLKSLWVSCEGENPADVEFVGPIQYIPRREFPGYFFPYTDKKGYQSPLIAVWFERPTLGVLINIECRLWAPNIEYDREKGRGFVHFELMID
ncbi:sodium/potassium-transporting ATPase subunit beta-2-like [Periplaneta americana]|uniref:sodium/potassium-transporting ATPase subunit beta-2-like n=1 Tax=Periplaneta americana TaxID=6978 RepID=UPI0037E7AD73